MIIFALLLLGGALFFPSFWVKRQLKKYGQHRNDLKGTGAELAEYLITQLNLESVSVVNSESDYYQASDQSVHLSSDVYHGRSVTALAVAAHEVGHAIQHQRRQPLFMARQTIAVLAMRAEKLAMILLMVWPIFSLITRSPGVGLVFIAIAALSFLVGIVAQLIVLPVEWDASFGKAMPLIESMQLLPNQDFSAARSILRAAAMTYVAASLMQMINVGRWLSILRR